MKISSQCLRGIVVSRCTATDVVNVSVTFCPGGINFRSLSAVQQRNSDAGWRAVGREILGPLAYRQVE